MNPRAHKQLDEHFEKGKNFLMAQQALLSELTETFETELWDCLEKQSFFRLGQKMTLSTQPRLQELLARQILFTWGLAFAVGSTTTTGESRPRPDE